MAEWCSVATHAADYVALQTVLYAIVVRYEIVCNSNWLRIPAFYWPVVVKQSVNDN